MHVKIEVSDFSFRQIIYMLVDLRHTKKRSEIIYFHHFYSGRKMMDKDNANTDINYEGRFVFFSSL